MKKVMLIPLMTSTALLGCQDTNQSDNQGQTSIESQKQVAAWAGKYEGTTPCMGCLSRCEDCPGMAVALELHEDKTYTLTRESLSGHNEVETLRGQLRFDAKDESKVELVHVAKRNLLYVDLEEKVLEIRADQTGKRYQMQSDFVLEKLA
ncbi:copper resistance protein NlpE N-terminal domain-containing protein [Acinetobacter bouvetii]|uniref:Lipoprotein involved with copper homeostasis and adhesion n=1 Tax=Acinetobacter bouvetii TaxID=202951 RepID=A0A811GAG3_9GAMM|nr:copper resistance protein NlpE N-terminal domain-containing protein [Acinetobacter bouvetii]CAB1213158.1 lipoprotein involved with copper homeostasis and adhesion [Acinetobacter bouvetii]